MRDILVLFIGIGLGIGAGYWLWFETPPAAVQPIELEPPTVESAKPQSEQLTEFEILMQSAERRVQQGEFVAAMELLMEAEYLPLTQSQQNRLSTELMGTLQQEVQQLTELGQHQAIDRLYESLTLQMPERAQIYLLLAEHRINHGSQDAALPVLAQIENHHQLGERARQLIEEITFNDEPLADIALTRSGEQFLVDATLDTGQPVRLLLDTGASMTVIRPDILDGVGYSLDGPEASFATAGGVVRAPLIELASIQLGGQRIEALTVGALALASPRRQVDGLLGMDVLSRYEFTVDQASARLILRSRRKGEN